MVPRAKGEGKWQTMPANVDQMFSVREMPWHREGVVLDDYPQSWDEARILAGLDWEPISAPVFTLSGIDAGTGNPIYEPVDNWQQVARSDTGATLALVRDSYEIINHSAFGQIFEAVLKQTNLKAETGGCLEGGRKVWMLIRLDEPIILPGDSSPTMPYLGLTGRHDAQGGVTLRATGVRIVCANTFNASELEGERTGATFSFVHRGKWQDRVDEAREAVTGARKEMKRYVEIASNLLGVKITRMQSELFVTEFIPAPPKGLASDRVLRNVEQARTRLREILASPTVAGAGIDGTAYGLVQGAGEYLDHVRSAKTWETKLGRTLLRPESMKHTAMKLALEVATH
jgi:phage/plasmid-like protein (TIGR03299 family)